jgi:formylmethanofuran dehydrogenase subunit B
MRRLRVLFESTLYGLGIKPTAELRVRAEEVIYRLESKYKDVPRDEAIERAVNDLLKWIEENVYFKA